MITEIASIKLLDFAWHKGFAAGTLEAAQKVPGVLRGWWCKSNRTLFAVMIGG